MRQVTYDSRKSFADFKLRVISVEVGEQRKREISVSIPYMDGNIDLSMLGGRYFYDNVTLTITFFTFDESLAMLYDRIENVKQWLYQAIPQELSDSFGRFPQSYRNVKCVSVSADVDDDMATANIVATFTAYPYKFKNYHDMPWDEFEFESDCMNPDVISVTAKHPSQYNEYAKIHVYNPSDRTFTPKVSFKSAGKPPGFVSLYVNGSSYYPSYYYHETEEQFLANFSLTPGDNIIEVLGWGTMTIIMEDEILC